MRIDGTGLCRLLIFLSITADAHAQGFNRRYDAFGWGFGQGGWNIERVQGGYLTISGSSDCDSISPDTCFFHGSVLLARIDEEGNLLWQKRAWRPAHSAFAGWANCCDTTAAGGYVVGGSSEAADGTDEVYLMRFDANGDTLWTRVFGDSNLLRYWGGRQVKTTNDGGFLIVGDTDQEGSVDGFAIKTDIFGVEEWTRLYDGPATTADALLSCANAGDSTYYMAGSVYPTSINRDIWVQRTDASGEPIWSVTWGGPFDDGSGHLTALSDGHALIANAHGFNEQGTQFKPALTKLDASDGSILWDRAYGPVVLNTVLFAAKETPSGDLIACGVTYAGEGAHQRGLLLRTTSEGDSLWMRSYYYQDDQITTGQGRFYDVLPTDDGGFIATGHAYFTAVEPTPPGTNQDTWVVKVDGEGCIVPGCNTVAGITEQATNLTDAVRLWPNPLAQGGTLAMEVDLPPAVLGKALTLSVVGSDGRLVHTQRLQGTTEQLATTNWAPGLYHLHLSSGTTWYAGASFVVE